MFSSFKNWLLERKASNLDFGCLMLYTDVPNWSSLIKLVDPSDVYTKDDDYGYEREPHITIIYGLHEDEIDKKELYASIQSTLKPVTVTIDTVGFFSNDTNPDYDVVKFDVPATAQLKRYRKAFLAYPNTQSFSGYHPHMTIAYVKKGQAAKYAQKVKPFKVTFKRAAYSNPDYRKKYFDLT